MKENCFSDEAPCLKSDGCVLRSSASVIVKIMEPDGTVIEVHGVHKLFKRPLPLGALVTARPDTTVLCDDEGVPRFEIELSHGERVTHIIASGTVFIMDLQGSTIDRLD